MIEPTNEELSEKLKFLALWFRCKYPEFEDVPDDLNLSADLLEAANKRIKELEDKEALVDCENGYYRILHKKTLSQLDVAVGALKEAEDYVNNHSTFYAVRIQTIIRKALTKITAMKGGEDEWL